MDTVKEWGRHLLLRSRGDGHFANLFGFRRILQYQLHVFLLHLSDLVQDFFVSLRGGLSQTIIDGLLARSQLFCDVVQVALELCHVAFLFSDSVGDGAKFRISQCLLLPRFQLFQLRGKFLVVGLGIGKALLSLLFVDPAHDLLRHLVEVLFFYRG